MENKAIQALKDGFLDGGIHFVSNFPGFFSHKLFEALGGKGISLNERAAYAQAFGASLSGLRSVVTFKNVGLNIASDAYLHSLLSGVNAGMVMVVTDDVEVWGSQERQDSRPFLDFYGSFWFEPTSLQEAYDFTYKSFELSEKYDIPIGIRLTNQFFELEGNYSKKQKQTNKKEIVKDPEKYVIHPIYWQKQHSNLQKKLARVQNYVNQQYEVEVTEKKKAIVSIGNNNKELADFKLNDYDVLSVNTYPMPLEIITDFINDRDEVIILEQGTNYAYQKIKADSNNIKMRSHTGNIPDLSSTYVKWDRYEKLFKALKAIEPYFVIGDVAQFTVDSLDTIDACLSLGVAMSTTIGLCNDTSDYPFCIVGDCSMLHEGLDVLNEALERDAKFGLVVIDNGGSWCTGGQSCTTDIKSVNQDIPTKTVDFNNTSQKDFESILRTMVEKQELSILYIKTEMGEFRIKS